MTCPHCVSSKARCHVFGAGLRLLTLQVGYANEPRYTWMILTHDGDGFRESGDDWGTRDAAQRAGSVAFYSHTMGGAQ